jgi:hypothetical protein
MLAPLSHTATIDGVTGIRYSYTTDLRGESNLCGGYFIPHAPDPGIDPSSISDPNAKLGYIVSSTVDGLTVPNPNSSFTLAAANMYFMIDEPAHPAVTPTTFNQDLAKGEAEFTTLLASNISASGLHISPSSTVAQTRIIPPDPQPSARPSGFFEWLTGSQKQKAWDIRQLVDADLARWDSATTPTGSIRLVATPSTSTTPDQGLVVASSGAVTTTTSIAFYDVNNAIIGHLPALQHLCINITNAAHTVLNFKAPNGQTVYSPNNPGLFQPDPLSNNCASTAKFESEQAKAARLQKMRSDANPPPPTTTQQLSAMAESPEVLGPLTLLAMICGVYAAGFVIVRKLQGKLVAVPEFYLNQYKAFDVTESDFKCRRRLFGRGNVFYRVNSDGSVVGLRRWHFQKETGEFFRVKSRHNGRVIFSAQTFGQRFTSYHQPKKIRIMLAVFFIAVSLFVSKIAIFLGVPGYNSQYTFAVNAVIQVPFALFFIAIAFLFVSSVIKPKALERWVVGPEKLTPLLAEGPRQPETRLKDGTGLDWQPTV